MNLGSNSSPASAQGRPATVDHRQAPAYGYGRWNRPLRTRRDYDAEVIRAVLRRNGRPEFLHPGDGFYVDGGRDGKPFLVACASRARRRQLSPAAEIAAYIAALKAAGMRVERPSGPDASPLILQVRLP